MVDAALTPEQLHAATLPGAEALVVAGAGTGKTRTLVGRIAWLLERGTPASEILCLVFTRSAAAEIRSRISAPVKVSTFHGLAHEHVITTGERIASPSEEEAARRSLYDWVDEHGNRNPVRLPPRKRPLGIEALGDEITAYEASGGRAAHSQVAIVLKRMKRARLVPMWQLLRRFGNLEDWPQVDHVLMDECQDATPGEWAMARACSLNGEVYAVGDPRQAIFGWRGAAEISRWQLPDVQLAYLSQCFRFGATLAHYVNRMMPQWPSVDGVGGPTELPLESFSLELLGELQRNRGLDVILCRTHRVCEHVTRELGEIAVHVRPDPYSAWAHESDRFAAVLESGKVLVTTVHSYKGREADRVALVSTPAWRRQWGDGEEARCRYVGATRAQRLFVEVELQEDIR